MRHLALLIMLFWSVGSMAQTDSENPDFECRLTVEKALIKIGELPKLKVEIVNLTTNEVYLIGSLDGSEESMRMPYCYFSIEKPKQDKYRTAYPRCGNMNGLKSDQFKRVLPNQVFEPYAEGFFYSASISRPENFKFQGIYKIQFHYSTKSEELKDFMGDLYRSDEEELQLLFEKVPKIELESNIIEIEVKR